MKIRKFYGKQLPRIVQTCLTNRLYVAGWTAGPFFRAYLEAIAAGKVAGVDFPKFSLTVGYIDNRPIAWCLKFIERQPKLTYEATGALCYREFAAPGSTWRFTRKIFRNQGVAKKLWTVAGKGRTFGDHPFQE